MQPIKTKFFRGKDSESTQEKTPQSGKKKKIGGETKSLSGHTEQGTRKDALRPKRKEGEKEERAAARQENHKPSCQRPRDAVVSPVEEKNVKISSPHELKPSAGKRENNPPRKGEEGGRETSPLTPSEGWGYGPCCLITYHHQRKGWGGISPEKKKVMKGDARYQEQKTTTKGEGQHRCTSCKGGREAITKVKSHGRS